MRFAACLVCLIVAPCGLALADWDTGVIARQRGDFTTAYRAFGARLTR